MKRISFPIILCLIFLLALASTGLGQASQVKNPLESDLPFSLKVRDVDIRDVLTIIAEEYGLNLILSPAVSGRITYDIENTTLRDGFNAILRSSGLTYIIEGNIIRVDEQVELRKKLKTELDIYKARQELREAQKLEKPLETTYVDLNYIGTTLSKEKGTETTDLQDAMEKLLSHNKEKGVDRGANVQCAFISGFPSSPPHLSGDLGRNEYHQLPILRDILLALEEKAHNGNPGQKGDAVSIFLFAGAQKTSNDHGLSVLYQYLCGRPLRSESVVRLSLNYGFT